MAVEWNITRAADEAQTLARELQALGLRARALPCIERTAVGWPTVPTGALLFLTSAAALPVPEGARDRPVAALAKVAEALRAAGHEVVAESDGGVVSLASNLATVWERSAKHQRAQVLYLCSDLAAQQPEHTEALCRLARFADVTCHSVYRVTAPAELAQALTTLCAESGLVFFSPSAVNYFLTARAAANAPAPRAVVVFGTSTERTWNEARPAGWPEAVMHRRDVPLSETLRRLS